MRAGTRASTAWHVVFGLLLVWSAVQGKHGIYTSAPETLDADAQDGWHSEMRRVCGGCRKLLKHVKQSRVDALLDLADKQQGAGDLATASKTMCAAVCAMTAARDLHRELPGALSNLGVLLKEQGFISAAEQCYRLASRLEPRNAGHYYRMGNARLAREELELARQSYMHATRLRGTFGDAYNNLGNCLMGMSRYRDAAAAYEYAVGSNPRNANYMVNLAGVLARNDLQGAIDSLQRALSIQPTFGEAWNNLANLYREQGSLDKSAQAYEEALKLMQGSGDVLVNLASVRGYMCEWRGRQELLQTILTLTHQQLKEGSKLSLSPFYANTFGYTPSILLALARYQAQRCVCDKPPDVLSA
jgi:tetratricopeptide (TPR) repeat protein